MLRRSRTPSMLSPRRLPPCSRRLRCGRRFLVATPA